MKIILLILFLLPLTACTDTELSRLSSLGKSAEITCFSGGKEFYHGKSTGKVLNATHSDGYEFEELGTGKLIRVSGDCLVVN